MKRTRVAVAIAGGLSLLIVGCSNDGEPAPDLPAATEATTAATPRGTYGSIDELLSAVEDAGALCKRWKQPVRQRLAFESRYCNKSSVEEVAIYADLDRRDKAARESRQFAKIFRNMPGETLYESILVGENWTVTGDLEFMEKLQQVLGGELQDNTEVSKD